ncbi:hypothetical protein Goklo_012147 [Gossypium klotzschianum]|uniref:NB-ARC domain-containing protein n=1 Tax=Gossypium klotzschianum TaxID=34286 RepID=A0A7J8VBN0_9ROSI|nr:hypothetical protein [Gossypium klotzschianum]
MGIAEKPIDLHTHYMFPFNKNAENFLEKERTLINSQIRLKGDVEKGKTKNQKIEEVVEDVLSKAKKTLQDEWSLEIQMQANPNLLRLKFDRVGHHVALPRLEFFLPMYAVASKSSAFALNEIMEALEDDEINMIGVWGIRGVGKATFVRATGNKIKESQLFDDVAMAIVSETLDVGKIQYTIVDSLGITFERRTREGKAKELWVELKTRKRFLIIVADVCYELNLINIGISFAMISLDLMDEEEVWNLFKLYAGLDNASLDIVEVVMKVAKKMKSSKLKNTKCLLDEDKNLLTQLLRFANN